MKMLIKFEHFGGLLSIFCVNHVAAISFVQKKVAKGSCLP